MPRPFVIQVHSGHGPLHCDLMLARDADGRLETWQLACSPAVLEAGGIVRADRLPDHRRTYLTYEGPVSRGRGEVRIFDRGVWRELVRRESTIRLRLDGEKLRGEFQLLRDENAWTFAPGP